MTLLKVNNRPVSKSWNGLVNDLFADFEQNFGQPKINFSAPVNIFETADAFNLEIAAPGRVKDQFSLNVENNTLTIAYADKVGAETKNEAKNETEQEVKVVEPKQIRREFAAQPFKRSFALDDKINTEAINAKYEDGVLKVLLPKKAEIKPAVKQISIQ
jgi:HSP20 family protein